ncbi:MAG: hypothetical protein ACLTZT_08555 [Butyricimonas faecalis]
MSAVTGFLNKYVNYANVKNQGVDIAVSGYIIRSKQVSWMSSLNLGYENKVTKSNITPQAQNLVKSVYTPGEVYWVNRLMVCSLIVSQSWTLTVCLYSMIRIITS